MVAQAETSRTTPGPDPSAGVAAVTLRIRELVAFANYYLAAQLDRAKLTAVNVGMFAVLGLFALAIGTAVVFTATVLLVVGLSNLLGTLLAFRPWLFWVGYLIVPILILGGLTAGVVIGFKMATKSTRGKMKAAYDQRKREQRASFGTDVDEQSR